MTDPTDSGVCPVIDATGRRPLEHSCCRKLAELEATHAAARDEWQVKLLKAEMQARKLAGFIVARMCGVDCDDPDARVEEGQKFGIFELRRVEPGSPDAEEWGEDAEMYYLAPWVRELAGGE